MSAVTKSTIGALACAAFVIARVPGAHHGAWLQALLLFAALVLVPLALELLVETDAPAKAQRLFNAAVALQLPAALLLVAACWLEPDTIAAALALPWVAFTGLLAVVAVMRARHGGLKRELHLLAADAAMIFSAIGGAWTLADRAGFRPLDFDAMIVALTAVHFHYAGLLLPLVAGLAQRELWMSRLAARAVVGSVLGVPAVALGITATQWGWTPAIEAGAGCGLALAGMAVAVLHVRLALEAKWPAAARVLLGIAGASLFFGMVLAALYATRAVTAQAPWLGIPQMQAIHGSVNAFGFALCGLLGWRIAARSGRAGPAA